MENRVPTMIETVEGYAKAGLTLLVATSLIAIGGCEDDEPEKADPGSGSALAPPVDIEVVGHIVKPKQLLPPDPSKLVAPDGFVVTRIVEDLGNARMLVVTDAGLY